MFSGLVQKLGLVTEIDGNRFAFTWPKVQNPFEIGESIAVNGCCLTVVDFTDEVFYADLVPETIHRTTMAKLILNDQVNLERSMKVGDAIGGHFVQGHIDCVGTIVVGPPSLVVSFDPNYALLVVEKGSITIDGVSLTVVAVGADSIEVAIIPHTTKVTTLGEKVPGSLVNLEFDILAKQVTRITQAHLARLNIPDNLQA